MRTIICNLWKDPSTFKTSEKYILHIKHFREIYICRQNKFDFWSKDIWFPWVKIQFFSDGWYHPGENPAETNMGLMLTMAMQYGCGGIEKYGRAKQSYRWNEKQLGFTELCISCLLQPSVALIKLLLRCYCIYLHCAVVLQYLSMCFVTVLLLKHCSASMQLWLHFLPNCAW